MLNLIQGAAIKLAPPQLRNYAIEGVSILLPHPVQRINISGTSLVFALLGILMARMIVFWSPYIMVLASVSLCDQHLWTFLVNKLNQSKTNEVLITFLRHLILCFILAVIYISHKDVVLAQLEELREFWDPDTVDLMEWIQQKVPSNAAFTGRV